MNTPAGITCKKCFHVNALGTLFCHGCGVKLDFTAADIMGTVAANQVEVRQERIFRTGRSILTLGSFALVSVLIVRCTVLPAVPPAELPRAEPRNAEKLLSVEAVGWGDAATAPTVAPTTLPAVETAVRWPRPVRSAGDEGLVAWRRVAAAPLLNAAGLDLSRIRAHQAGLAAAQTSHGSFPGADRLAATALALLALQAWPGEPTIDAAASRAADWLASQMPVLQRGGASPLAHTLTVWALLEARPALPGLRLLTDTLATGREPRWQVLALQRLPPSERPKILSAVVQKLDAAPIWQANLDALQGSLVRRAEFRAMNDPLHPDALDAVDRLAWASWQWLQLGDLKLLHEKLRAWSSEEQPFPAPAALSALTGPQTDFALAVLTATVPAHMPVTWNATRR